MTMTFTLTVDTSAGGDTSLFFPGSRQVDTVAYEFFPDHGGIHFRSEPDDKTLYDLLFYGSDVKKDPDTSDFSMHMTSAKLFVEGAAAPLMDLSIDFGDTGREWTPLKSGFYFSQDNMLNFYQSASDDPTFVLNGNAGADRLYGSARGDILDGKGGADIMYGRAGDDRYSVDNAKDVIAESAGEGSDYVLTSLSYGLKAGVEVERLSTTSSGGSTAMNLAGNEFSQRIDGNQAGNKIVALDGADTLYGLGGNDALYGGMGKDLLTGGLGNDSFIFDTALVSNVDTIADFHNVSGDNDTLRLVNSVFAKLGTAGKLNDAFFDANAAGKAIDANDYVVYDTDSGALFYDADGSGAGKAIQFATLTGHPAVTAADFLVV